MVFIFTKTLNKFKTKRKMKKKIVLNKLKIAKITNLSTVNGGNLSADDVCRSIPLVICPDLPDNTKNGNELSLG